MNALSVKISLALVLLLSSSCSALHHLVNYETGAGRSLWGVATVDGRFRVELIECMGNPSSQQVVAILSVTNMGPNVDNIFIGGSLNNTLAIDSYGAAYKPYSSSGKQYTLPTNIAVRVLVEGIGPIVPNVGAFRSLRVSVGNGKYNIAEFRNVPIVWSNL